jgi:hypothetical protein
MTAHTPTPWKAMPRHVSADETYDRLGFRCTISGSDADAKANARFIALACNVHDELVAAVKAFLVFDADDHSDGVGAMLNYNDALVKAKAAIAKVQA